MTINEYMHKHYKAKTYNFFTTQDLRPRVICNDGFTMSVQGSYYHYSTPRLDGDIEYEKLEIGYPSMREDLIMEFAENAAEPTDTVYGYVPVEVIDAVIIKHGGFKEELHKNETTIS